MKTMYILLIIASIGLSSQTFAWGLKNDYQTELCLVQDGNAASKECKNGDVMLFLPPSFGNEQLPIGISAAFCDFEHPVVHNAGGVSCIFTDARKKNWNSLGIGVKN